MGELLADLFISLDGFAGGEDFGPYFGYGGPELDAWVQEHLDAPQQVVLGRKTYEALASLSAGSDSVSTGLTALPKLVVSNTLEEPLAWANSRVLRGDAAEELRRVKDESDIPLRAMGSLSLVKSLLQAGVLDRLRFMVFPLVAGARGREPAFAELTTKHMELVETRVLDGRLVSLEYRTTT
jgi:dihydrofolate reductase